MRLLTTAGWRGVGCLRVAGGTEQHPPGQFTAAARQGTDAVLVVLLPVASFLVTGQGVLADIFPPQVCSCFGTPQWRYAFAQMSAYFVVGTAFSSSIIAHAVSL
jgi:hypothetical protein